MFGMGLTEIFIVAVIAIIFLGPEKLPNAMVQIAKFFRQIKKGVTEAKETLDHELRLEELKENANSYKNRFQETAHELIETAKLDNIYNDTEIEREELEVVKEEKKKKENKKINSNDDRRKEN